MLLKRLKPKGDRVVIVRVDEESPAGTIIVPDNVKEKPQIGEVVAVGPGRLMDDGSRYPIDVAPGEHVLFAKYGGLDVQLGPGQEYTILREDEIMSVVEQYEYDMDAGGDEDEDEDDEEDEDEEDQDENGPGPSAGAGEDASDQSQEQKSAEEPA